MVLRKLRRLTLTTIQSSTEPPRVKPLPEPGYIYLYSEDDLMHFCWRGRSVPLDDPELDLVMIPADGSFTRYGSTNPQNPSNSSKPSNGRIYVLKFSSSSQRHLFWLQSRSQHESADPAWFSARDLKLGGIVNTLLQGEEIDVQQAIASLPDDGNDRDKDDDATMEDVDGQNDVSGAGSGGAGAGATGGDIREEGHEAREGGADGGRA
jgi:26S proteasome regulatory subunit N13